MANSKVFVRVMKNGVVVHKHEGANGYHDPSRKHGTNAHYGVETDLHKRIGKAALDKPEGLDKLSVADQAQYVAALAGKTFWVYSKKAEAPAAEPVKVMTPAGMSDPTITD